MSTSRTVALIGCTGSGKSTFGNHLLGRTAFPVSRGFKQQTTTIGCGRGPKGGIDLEVFDIPDYVNMKSNPGELEMKAPDAVLLTLRCDSKYAQEDYKQAHAWLKMVPNGSTDRLILTFTHVPKGIRSEFGEYLKDAGPYFQDLLDEVDKRYILFSTDEDGEALVSDLASFIERMQQSAAGRRKWWNGLLLWTVFCIISFKSQTIWLLTVPQSNYIYVAAAVCAAAVCPWLIFYLKNIRLTFRKCLRQVKTALYSFYMSRIRSP